MSQKYFIKPTAKILNPFGNLLSVDTNYYNSRCENASIFIKNFTLAILVKEDADLSFVQNLEKDLNTAIDRLKVIANEISNYTPQNPSNSPLDGIYVTVKNTVEHFQRSSNGINRDELKKIGYANILDKVEGLIELVRKVSQELVGSIKTVNDEYKELIKKIKNIVEKINDFINCSYKVASTFKDSLYVFNTENENERLLFEHFNEDKLFSPCSAKSYFSLNLNYQHNSAKESDFTKYFKNIYSEKEIIYDDTKNIKLSATSKFRYKEKEQIIEKEVKCKLWLVPVSTFILLRAFARVNQERKEKRVLNDHIGVINSASESYEEHVKNNKSLYLKKILISPANDQIMLDKDTIQSLKVNEMELLWPKSPGGKLLTSLTLKDLIMMHFRDVRKHDTFGNIIGFRGTRYENKVKEFIRDNEYLSISRVKADNKYDRSVEGLIDRINGFTGSKNSRLVRKISIFISSYITEKFQFSLYDNVKTGAIYKDYDETKFLSSIVSENKLLEAKKKSVIEKIKANNKVVEDIQNQLISLTANIKKIDDILNERPNTEDKNHDEGVSVSLDDENIDSIENPCFSLELGDKSHVKIKIDKKQLNRKVVQYSIAKVLNNILFSAKINVMDKLIKETELPGVFLDPLVEALQYDINDKSIVRSSFMGYFMAIMYMSLPYHKCFQRRNWWDIYHLTPKSRILFMSKAANWYYKAYYDICRELWYSVGPFIGSNLDLQTVRSSLRENLRSNLENKNLKVGYENAYSHKDSISKRIDTVGSAVTYISSMFIYDNAIQEEDLVSTEVNENIDLTSLDKSTTSIKRHEFERSLESHKLERSRSFQLNSSIDGKIIEVGNWMRESKFLESNNLDYATLMVLTISLHVESSHKYIVSADLSKRAEVFTLLNKVFFSDYGTSIHSSYNLENRGGIDRNIVNVLLNIDKDFIDFAISNMGEQYSMMSCPNSDRTESVQQDRALKLLLVIQMLYLKIVSYRYSLDIGKGGSQCWDDNIYDPCYKALESKKSSYHLGGVYKKCVLEEVIRSYNAIFGDKGKGIRRITKPVGEWTGWHTDLTSTNQKAQIIPFVKDVMNGIYMYTQKFIIGSNILEGETIFDHIIAAVKTNNVLNKYALNSYEVYGNNLKNILIELKDGSKENYFTVLVYGLLLACMALVTRTAYKYGSKFAGVADFQNKIEVRTSEDDIQSILKYCLPFYIFCANMVSRIAIKNQPLDLTLTNIYTDPSLADTSIDRYGGINISSVYAFIRSFIVEDKYVESDDNKKVDLSNMSIRLDNMKVLDKTKYNDNMD
ncbi:hypothetical protein [Francisella sp. SYW-9]|uniref:hypothetical protein n=1 Tax=Francisella sp. SYW-9 TaxID=2610888 RepID=UPI00123CEDCA|nr:hypothetical protein [Francisella sp. SYW-9]